MDINQLINLIMKKVFLIIAIVFTTSLFAQNIVHIQYRYVPTENVAEFESLETEYWSKIKKNAIENGDMLASAFLDFMEEQTMKQNQHTLLFKYIKVLSSLKDK